MIAGWLWIQNAAIVVVVGQLRGSGCRIGLRDRGRRAARDRLVLRQPSTAAADEPQPAHGGRVRQSHAARDKELPRLQRLLQLRQRYPSATDPGIERATAEGGSTAMGVRGILLREN